MQSFLQNYIVIGAVVYEAMVYLYGFSLNKKDKFINLNP